MMDLSKLGFFNKQPGNSLLGLSFDGTRLEGVHVRRTNGSVEIKNTFAVSLTLDPLTAETELVGREIRKQLDSLGIRERWCTVCLPLNWVLTLNVKLPEIPEEDVESFLQIEAERGFPYGPEALVLSRSRYRTSNGESHATLVAVPREHVVRLEAVLQAAQLRPASFSLGITALQPPKSESSDGVLALLPAENSVRMQISFGGGVAVLRTIEGAFEQVGVERELQVEQIARETRITLGQLPAEVRDAVRRLRIFGRSDAADELAQQLRPRLEPMGIKVEQVRDHASQEFGIKIPSGTTVSPALSVAVRRLAGGAGLEFLPPKVSAWKQFSERYSSGKLVYAGGAAGAVAVIILLAFLVQQIVLWHWKSKWSTIEPKVTELNKMQSEIQLYRPWFDPSVRTLTILKRLTEAFPQDGGLFAKSVEIRESTKAGQPPVVTCSGTAKNRDLLIAAMDHLRGSQGVGSVHLQNTRGDAPLEFTFDFQWIGRGIQ